MAEAVAAEVLSAIPLDDVASRSFDVPAHGCAAEGAPGGHPVLRAAHGRWGEGLDGDATPRGPAHGCTSEGGEGALATCGQTRTHSPPFLPSLVEGLAEADAFELDARLRRAVRLEQRLCAEMGPLLVELARRRGYRAYGCPSLGVFAREWLGISPRKAQALLRLERASGDRVRRPRPRREARRPPGPAHGCAPHGPGRTPHPHTAARATRRVSSARSSPRCSGGSSAAAGDPRASPRPSPPCSTTRSSPGARTRRSLPSTASSRDGWRCTAPGCTSYRNLHDHPIRLRSAGGSDELSNRTTLCAWHHLRGVHAGVVRVTGQAPHGLRFELGVRSGKPPLAVYRSGDVAC